LTGRWTGSSHDSGSERAPGSLISDAARVFTPRGWPHWGRIVLDKYAIVTPSRFFEVFNWLQYYSRERLRSEFAANGFEIEAWFADVAGKGYREDAPEMAVVARKKR
jgi:hypothetical protein